MPTKSPIKPHEIVNEFQELVASYIDSEKLQEHGFPSIKYCADCLCISSNYLSEILRRETGRSALDHIHMSIINRAKKLLLNDMRSVRSIAYDLGFNYPHYFNRLFKLKTGMTPSQFRLNGR